jgi:hypothetical protein
MHVEIELDGPEDPVHGWIVDADGRRRFYGWLELAAAVERRMSRKRSSRPAAPEARPTGIEEVPRMSETVRSPLLRLRLFALALAATTVLTTACSDGGGDAASDATPTTSAAAEAAGIPSDALRVSAQRTFVGEAEGTDALVVVNLTRNEESGVEEAELYMCDGDKLVHSAWGEVKGAALSFGRDVVVDATLDADTVAGKLTVAGNTYDFTSTAVLAPAGLYLAVGRDTTEGFWVRAADGSFRGVAKQGETIVGGSGGAGSAGDGPASSGGGETTDTTVETDLLKTCRGLVRVIRRTGPLGVMGQEPAFSQNQDALIQFARQGCPNSLLSGK